MPFDCWKCVEEKHNIDYCLNSRQINIKMSPELIEVNSCFGGIAIYKTKYLKNCNYYGGEGKNQKCEHVKLNEDIRKNGGKIYINPEFINF